MRCSGRPSFAGIGVNVGIYLDRVNRWCQIQPCRGRYLMLRESKTGRPEPKAFGFEQERTGRVRPHCQDDQQEVRVGFRPREGWCRRQEVLAQGR